MKAIRTGWLALACLLLPMFAIAQAGVPNVFSPTESEFQKETHFLTFLSSVPESAATATAYYNAIDPTASKRNVTQWLVNAGFIANAGQWHPTGPQKFACNFAGCDYPAGTYGDNIINADAHVIVLNAADLGFVRNQFIRCKPSCTAKNPIIYTYLENYPVAPFAVGGSGFGTPGGSSYPAQSEITAAINSALTRPTGTVNGLSIERIADVCFEWAPPATNPTSTQRYGQLYAFLFTDQGNGNYEETIGVPSDSPLVGKSIPNFADKTDTSLVINAGDPFPPNLDGLGFKQHPGVCFICHGGEPKALTSTGAYPRGGNVSGFRLLPLDIRNLGFTSDLGTEVTSRVSQEGPIKLYNQIVLKTVPLQTESDGTGAVRLPHLAEVIRGWYAAFNGDTTMSAATQNVSFIPVGWREAIHGGSAPANSEALYENVVSPSCRSCHFNREVSLDFGTAANFKQESDIKELALLPYCSQNNPKPGAKFMPLAHLTFQKFWEANANPQTLPSGQPPLTLSSTGDKLAQWLGYPSGLAGYCASHP